MKSISAKVQRTASESSDSSVYAIKAMINFTNTRIYNNDLFMSASTQSVVSLTNSSLSGLVASNFIIQAVSSTVEFYNFTVRDITHSVSPNTYYQYISIVNKSKMRIESSLFT